MKTSIGDNNRKERFDFYKWTAPFFNTPKEVVKYIDSLNLKNKILSRINIIGFAHCQTSAGYLYSKLTEAGIELRRRLVLYI